MNNAQFDMLGMFHTYIYIALLLSLQIYVYVSLLMDGLSLNIFDDIGVLHDDIIWCGSFSIIVTTRLSWDINI